MSNRRKIKGERNLRYNLTIWSENCAFGILNDIIENVTLVHLMDSLVNLNCAIIIVGHWVFDYNYKKALCLTQVLMDLICSSIGGELVATFRSVFYAVRYIWGIRL